MESPSRYKKVAGFAMSRGQDFEVNLAALLYLRGLNSGQHFQLATNVQGAGALDDLVFRFKPKEEPAEWTTMYVQLKHKERIRLTRKVFISKKGEFSLPRYFESYLGIKKAMSIADRKDLFDGSFEKCVCVIFTNAVNKSESLGERRCENLTQAEELLWTDSGSVFSFQDDENILKCLGDCGDDGRMFLRSLRVFCDQPNANDLIGNIIAELSKVSDKIKQGVNPRRLCEIFLEEVAVWWETSHVILHEAHDLLSLVVEKVMLETLYTNTLAEFSLKIHFEESALLPLRLALVGKMMVFVAVSESSFRLSFTKFLQAIGGRPLVLTCKSLLDNKGTVLEQWRKEEVKSLVICTNDWRSRRLYEGVLKNLCNIRHTSTERSIFFLTRKIDVTSDILKMFPGCEFVRDEPFLFSQLSKQSQECILDKTIVVQGCVVMLRNLLNSTAEGAANLDEYLDASSVVEVLASKGTLSLGPSLVESVGYYIDRSLELAKVVKPSVFQDDFLQEAVSIRVKHYGSSADRKLLQDPDLNIKSKLFENAINLLSSIQEAPLNHNVEKDEIAKNLTQSLLEHYKDDFFTGPKFRLGVFQCRAIGLRFGKDDAVTALQVRSSKQFLQVAYFLFVSDKTNENDAKKLFDFHQSKHLLSLEKGQLRWIQSSGDIKFIRNHIDEKQVFSVVPETAMSVDNRLVLVCSEPDMGKSTLMARLAKKTKVAFPNYFVILIALNDQTELFAKGKHRDVPEFLSKAAKMESPLQRSLLKFALDVSGNVVVILDGVDEIFPNYSEESCDFLSSLLQETKANKVWMTSLNSIKSSLETRFSIFAAKLRNFQVSEMKILLKKIWKTISPQSDQEITRFIDELFKNISQTIQDKELDFLVNPLQTQMLAEVFEDHVVGSHTKIKLPKSLNLLSLLDYAFEKKCYRDFHDNPHMKENFVAFRENCIASHAKAALISILGDDDIKRLGMKKMLEESKKFFDEIQSGKDKSGFIVEIKDDKPRFSHSIYPDYFVAKWFSGHFEVYPELLTSKMYSENFVLIHKFFYQLRKMKIDSFGDAGRVLFGSRFCSEYEFTADIAEGGFGTVQRVRNIFDDKEYAVKMVRLRHENLEDSAAQLSEVKISALTDHDCIARYKCAWIEPFSSPHGERASLDYPISNANRFSLVSSENSIEFRQFSSYKKPSTCKLVSGDLTVVRYVGSTELMKYDSSGSQAEEDSSDGPTLYILMDYYKENLRFWLDRRNEDRGKVEVTRSLTAAKQIFRGIEYLHTLGCVHHDIKPANIFVDELLQDVKIGDFGLSCVLRTSGPLQHGKIGSVPYAAPDEECNPKSDIYSGGIVLLELLIPFGTSAELAKTLERLQQEDNLLQMPSLLPEQVELIKLMICRTAESRPTASDVLTRLDWIQEPASGRSEENKDNTIFELKKVIAEMEQEILKLRKIIAEKNKQD